MRLMQLMRLVLGLVVVVVVHVVDVKPGNGWGGVGFLGVHQIWARRKHVQDALNRTFARCQYPQPLKLTSRTPEMNKQAPLPDP